MSAPQNDAVRIGLRVTTPDLQDSLWEWAKDAADEAVSDAVSVTETVDDGVTVSANGVVGQAVYKVVVDKSAFVTEDTTSTVQIGVLPIGCSVLRAYMQVTEAFALGMSALTLAVGIDTNVDGAVEESDATDDAVVYGDESAERGADLGKFLTLAEAKDLTMTLVSDTDDIGDGTVTALTAGSVTVWLVVEKLV